jgi:hypothetical protein
MVGVKQWNNPVDLIKSWTRVSKVNQESFNFTKVEQAILIDVVTTEEEVDFLRFSVCSILRRISINSSIKSLIDKRDSRDLAIKIGINDIS